MANSTRTNAFSIDLQFGAIRFVRGTSSAFALVNVEVSIEDASFALDTGTKVSMDFRIPADPEVDTVATVAENARQHMISRLRSAVAILEQKSSDALLYSDDGSAFLSLDL